jgi:hypothetical protein
LFEDLHGDLLGVCHYLSGPQVGRDFAGHRLDSLGVLTLELVVLILSAV